MHPQPSAQVSAWAYVEWQHCELFALVASGHSQNKPLERAYWAIISFDGRQRMVDAALKEALNQHPAYLARWNSLSNRLHAKSKQRNRLAHAQLAQFPQAIGPPLHALVTGIYSATSFGPDRRISHADIVRMKDGFSSLGDDLLGFHEMFFTEQLMPIDPIPRYSYPSGR